MKKILSLIVTLIMFVTIFSACGSKDKDVGDMKAGSWSDNSFTNTWSDIAITLPENYYVYSADEMQSLIKNQGNFVYNGSDKISGTLDPSKEQSLYDFVVASANQNLMLGYDNLVSVGKLCSAKKYLEIVKKQILENKSYSFDSTSTGKIAGETYDTMILTATQNNEKIFSKTYARKFGHYMIFFIATYTADSESSMNDLLNSVTKVADAKTASNTSAATDAATADGTTLNRISPKV